MRYTVKVSQKFIIVATLFLLYILIYNNIFTDNEDQEIVNYEYNFTYALTINSVFDNNKVILNNIYYNTSSIYHEILYSENNFDIIKNKICHIDFNNNTIFQFNLTMNSNNNIVLKQTHIIKYNNFNKEINKYVINSDNELYRKYTASEDLIESEDNNIVNEGNQIVAEIADPFQKCIAFNEWVHENINYTGYDRTTHGAKYALNNLHGDCSEYSTLFIALCRSQGIPARQIDGIANPDLTNHIQDWEITGHDWAEVYFSNCGWIWVDPTHGWYKEAPGLYLPLQYGFFEKNHGYRYYWLSKGINVDEKYFISIIN